MSFLFVLAVGLVAGTLSGIVGTGSSVMLMPVLIYAYGPKEAVPIMAIAAVMANLDLIISSCTSIPHLAGALGRPTWVVLKHVPDWRWLLDREDSPWYPTMRLFRQPERDDWTSVFSKIERELRSQLNAKADAIVLRELNRVEETAPTPKSSRYLIS